MAATNAIASKVKPQVVKAGADRGVIIANAFCQLVATHHRDHKGPAKIYLANYYDFVIVERNLQE